MLCEILCMIWAVCLERLMWVLASKPIVEYVIDPIIDPIDEDTCSPHIPVPAVENAEELSDSLSETLGGVIFTTSELHVAENGFKTRSNDSDDDTLSYDSDKTLPCVHSENREYVDANESGSDMDIDEDVVDNLMCSESLEEILGEGPESVVTTGKRANTTVYPKAHPAKVARRSNTV